MRHLNRPVTVNWDLIIALAVALFISYIFMAFLAWLLGDGDD